MTRFLINLPIKRKVIVVILLTSMAGLIAASVALFLFQLIAFRKSFVRDIDVLSEIIANQSTAVVAFKFEKETTDFLAALRGNPAIVSAVIDLKGGTVLGRYGTETNLTGLRAARPGSPRFEGDYLLHAHPIVANEDEIGMLYLRVNYRQEFDKIVRAHVGTLGVAFVGSVLLTLALSTRLQRVISNPILGLADTARAVAENKDYSTRALKIGEDEVGLFTDAFNQMLAQIQGQDSALKTARSELEMRVKALQHEIAERERAEHQLDIAHRELLEASRRAGMAEVATGVLHNVGNVLNSVNVSAALLRDTVGKSEIATVEKLAALLRDHSGDLPEFLANNPQGRHVPRLITTLADQLAYERKHLMAELDLLARNIDHIKNIVAMQQSYATTAGFVESVEADSLVEDAVEINAAALTRHGVKIIRQYQPAPPLTVDKHKVLQVLVNLIQNAKYALQESGRSDKELTVRIERKKPESIEIIVQDNGVGIPPENITRIFGHGFTTRKKGHGFGLHASALAARELGGDLRAESGGPGQGATFTLELPVAHRDE